MIDRLINAARAVGLLSASAFAACGGDAITVDHQASSTVPADFGIVHAVDVRGIIGRHGYADDEFLGPFGIHVADDRIIVIDDLAHRIQVFDERGTLTQVMGRFGSGALELAFPDAAWLDNRGELFIADTGNNRIQVWTPDGRFLREFGRGWRPGALRNPRDVRRSAAGDIIVADFSNGRIRVYRSDGVYQSDIGRSGRNAGLSGPIQMTYSAAGELFVSDTKRHAVMVFDQHGRFDRAFGTHGDAPGQLSSPHGLDFSPNGYLYVADHGNHRVQVFAPDGTPVGIIGGAGTVPGRLREPTDLSFSSDGRLFIVDRGNHRVQIWDVPRPEPTRGITSSR